MSYWTASCCFVKYENVRHTHCWEFILGVGHWDGVYPEHKLTYIPEQLAGTAAIHVPVIILATLNILLSVTLKVYFVVFYRTCAASHSNLIKQKRTWQRRRPPEQRTQKGMWQRRPPEQRKQKGTWQRSPGRTKYLPTITGSHHCLRLWVLFWYYGIVLLIADGHQCGI